MRADRRGFTLIEVLAAVAVFGIVYTVLAQAAMQGLAAEGDAERRLRASLLADRALGEIEAQIAAGAAPPPGETELEEGEFVITAEVRPFDLAALLPREMPEYLPNPERLPERSLELLRAPDRGPSPLIEVLVRVRWVEGAFDQEVTRTTWAADPAAAAPLLEGLAGAGEGDGGGEDDDDDDAGEGTDAPRDLGGNDAPRSLPDGGASR